jgi:hypothetical protein
LRCFASAQATACPAGRAPSWRARPGWSTTSRTPGAGRSQKSEARFARLRGLANDVGLLSEEYDTASRRLVGNFSQAWSHVGLVSSAAVLSDVAGAAVPRTARQRADAATA